MYPIAIYRAQHPYLFFVAAFISGILLAFYLPVSSIAYDVVLVGVVLALGTFTALAWRSKWKDFRLFDLAGLSFFAILIGLGCLLTWKDIPEMNAQHFSHYPATRFLGYVVSDPDSRGDFLSVELKVSAVKERELHLVDGTLLLRIDQRKNPISLRYGDELLLEGHVQRIDPPFNPHAFDYAQYMANRNIWHQLYLSSQEIKKTGRLEGSKLIRYAFTLRRYLLFKFEQQVTNKASAALLSTLVLGYRAALDKDLVQAFSTTGTIHVLSVSGMHVGIVFAFFAWGMRWMENRRYFSGLRLLILLILVWCYALITGFSSSICRASFMISFMLIGQVGKQSRHTYNHIAASAFFLLLFYPKYLLAVDFQLSYLAVIGMVWIAPKANACLNIKHKFGRQLVAYLLLSCAAQVLTFPLVLYYFHSFPTYFLVANLLVVLPATLIIYGGFVLLLVPIAAITRLIGFALEKLIALLNELLITVAHWPGATIKSVWISPYECIMLYFVLITCVLTCQYANKKLFYGMLGCFIGLTILTGYRVWNKATVKQLIIFNVQEQMAIALLDGNKPILYSNIKSTQDVLFSYAIRPTIEAQSTIENLVFIPSPAKSCGVQFSINGDLIQFMGRTLFILDGKRRNKLPARTPHWLLLRNDASCNLSVFSKAGRRKPILILDASNHIRTLKKYAAEAKRFGFEIYCLKDNFAYVWDAKKQR
ncbi:ComEC/Rec2 family competence protein [Olivibacter ginsenosidimutans]|uniref:ComEC/Rec2 family competence protein n=1 Tax=Olivibacter ginsenosidimutans TaxID=1176537 RepID=A0ABP9CCQ5_9SPHI